MTQESNVKEIRKHNEEYECDGNKGVMRAVEIRAGKGGKEVWEKQQL